MGSKECLCCMQSPETWSIKVVSLCGFEACKAVLLSASIHLDGLSGIPAGKLCQKQTVWQKQHSVRHSKYHLHAFWKNVDVITEVYKPLLILQYETNTRETSYIRRGLCFKETANLALITKQWRPYRRTNLMDLQNLATRPIMTKNTTQGKILYESNLFCCKYQL